MRKQFNNDIQHHYSFRKLSVGLVSAAVGAFFVTYGGQTVNADTTNPASTAVEQTKTAQVTKDDSATDSNQSTAKQTTSAENASAVKSATEQTQTQTKQTTQPASSQAPTAKKQTTAESKTPKADPIPDIEGSVVSTPTSTKKSATTQKTSQTTAKTAQIKQPVSTSKSGSTVKPHAQAEPTKAVNNQTQSAQSTNQKSSAEKSNQNKAVTVKPKAETTTANVQNKTQEPQKSVSQAPTASAPTPATTQKTTNAASTKTQSTNTTKTTESSDSNITQQEVYHAIHADQPDLTKAQLKALGLNPDQYVVNGKVYNVYDLDVTANGTNGKAYTYTNVPAKHTNSGEVYNYETAYNSNPTDSKIKSISSQIKYISPYAGSIYVTQGYTISDADAQKLVDSQDLSAIVGENVKPHATWSESYPGMEGHVALDTNKPGTYFNIIDLSVDGAKYTYTVGAHVVVVAADGKNNQPTLIKITTPAEEKAAITVKPHAQAEPTAPTSSSVNTSAASTAAATNSSATTTVAPHAQATTTTTSTKSSVTPAPQSQTQKAKATAKAVTIPKTLPGQTKQTTVKPHAQTVNAQPSSVKKANDNTTIAHSPAAQVSTTSTGQAETVAPHAASVNQSVSTGTSTQTTTTNALSGSNSVSNSNKQNTLPQTGEKNTNLGLIGLTLVSVAGLISLAAERKRKN